MCRPELGRAACETLLWFALLPHSRHAAAQWSAQTKAQTKLSRTSARLLTGRGGGANHAANQSLLGTPPAKGEGRTGLLWSNLPRCCSCLALRWGIEPSQVTWHSGSLPGKGAPAPGMKQPASPAKTVGALSRGHLRFHGH